MTEWFKVPVLKTGVFKIPWVRIPFHPHFFCHLMLVLSIESVYFYSYKGISSDFLIDYEFKLKIK